MAKQTQKQTAHQQQQIAAMLAANYGGKQIKAFRFDKHRMLVIVMDDDTELSIDVARSRDYDNSHLVINGEQNALDVSDMIHS